MESYFRLAFFHSDSINFKNKNVYKRNKISENFASKGTVWTKDSDGQQTQQRRHRTKQSTGKTGDSNSAGDCPVKIVLVTKSEV